MEALTYENGIGLDAGGITRAVVTGGAGFIGSHVVECLLCHGVEVAVVDDLSTGRRENVHRDASLVVADVTDPLLPYVMRDLDPDVVFHLAARADVRASVADPVGDAYTNVLGTVRVLEAAADAGAQVVFASSGGAVYGECGAPRSEQDALRPVSPYAVAKASAEGYMVAWRLLRGQQNVVLRYANVYGPRQRPELEAGVVSIFADAILGGITPVVFGDGLQTRDFVYVHDVALATVQAASLPAGVYNVGTGVDTSVRDLLDLVWMAAHSTAASLAVPLHAEDRVGELRRSVLDPSKLRRHLPAWDPIPLETGVRRTVRALLAEKDATA